MGNVFGRRFFIGSSIFSTAAVPLPPPPSLLLLMLLLLSWLPILIPVMTTVGMEHTYDAGIKKKRLMLHEEKDAFFVLRPWPGVSCSVLSFIPILVRLISD